MPRPRVTVAEIIQAHEQVEMFAYRRQVVELALEQTTVGAL
jgi:hypothetical protein